MPNTVHLIYKGSPQFASALVSCLENEGLHVAWTPPMENRSIGEHLLSQVDMAASSLEVLSVVAAVKLGVTKFKQRFPGDVDIEPDQDDEIV
jgi:hypothetical protein